MDAVRNTPYAVVLLDEIEKAHPDLFNILLQVMDHATLTDNNGRKADFRQVVLIMTCNAGSREMAQAAIGFSLGGGEGRDKDTQRRGQSALERLFSPEFRNRLDAIVTFRPLSPETMETIVEKFILQLEAQLTERRVAITLAARGPRLPGAEGVRPGLRRAAAGALIQDEVRDPLTDEILFGRLEHGGTVTIGVAEEKLTFACEASPPPAEQDPAEAPAPEAAG